MSLCGPCREKSQAWLDYRLSPPPIALVAIGRQDVRHVLERTEARFREWRDTIRWHQAHIADLCARGVHAGPGGGSSGSSSPSSSARSSSGPAYICIELPTSPPSGSRQTEE